MSQKSTTSDALIRVTTKEIDDTVEQLQIAFSDGRLDEKDFDERMAKALKSKTRGELFLLTNDLEMTLPSTTNPHVMRRISENAVAIFSGIEQKGNFLVPKNYRVKAIFGGCSLDFTKASFASKVTEIYITAIFGGIEILVPKGVRVEIHGTPIFGGFSKKSSEDLPHDAPVIHIYGVAIFGGVEIRAK